MAKEIETEVIQLILDKEFFLGHFIQQFKRNPITKDMPDYKVIRTLGVNITDDMRPNLYYNVDFYNAGDGLTWGLTKEERIAVLKHEVLHVMNKHLVRTEGRNHYVFNVASDVAINQFIDNLPRGGMCPDCNIFVRKETSGAFRKRCPLCGKELDPKTDICEPLLPKTLEIDTNKLDLDDNRPAEIYYDILWKKMPKEVVSIGGEITGNAEQGAKGNMSGQGQGNGQPQGQGQQGKQGQGQQQGQGKGTGKGNVQVRGVLVPLPLDAHEAWDVGTANHEMAHEKIKDMVQKAVNESNDRSQGTLPGWMQNLINQCLAHKTVNWKSELRKFYGYAEFARYIQTRKRLNRRFALMPGYKVERKAHFVVAADSSGSVSDEEFAKFFKEIEVMRNHAKVAVTLVECDADITNVEDYHKRPKKNGKIKRYGYGGTDFRPVFEFAKKKVWKSGKQEYRIKGKVDGIIYLTDGAGSYPKEIPCPTIWVMTKNHWANEWKPSLGKKIVMDD